MIKKITIFIITTFLMVLSIRAAHHYKEVFHYVGLVFMGLSSVILSIGLFINLELDIEWRKYTDRNFLKNLGWTDQEFNEWMRTERHNMTEEQSDEFQKKYIKWWFPYINLNITNKKTPRK